MKQQARIIQESVLINSDNISLSQALVPVCLKTCTMIAAVKSMNDYHPLALNLIVMAHLQNNINTRESHKPALLFMEAAEVEPQNHKIPGNDC